MMISPSRRTAANSPLVQWFSLGRCGATFAMWLAVLPAGFLVSGCASGESGRGATPQQAGLEAPATGGAEAAETTEPPDRPGKRPLKDYAALAAGSTPGIAGYSVNGKPIPYHVRGSGPETVLLLATIHGDEAAGTPLLERLIGEVNENPGLLHGRRLVVVPVVNPDGLAADRRRNARVIDLNRNFPAANRRDNSDRGSALSEPEAQALHALIVQFEPTVAVSIHGWLGLVDWDGPAESLAQIMGELCGLPAERIGSRPGSLGSFLGVDRGVPTITLELPSSASAATGDELWERYGAGLLATLSWSP
ncbi:MAG: protein MpaA [Pseudohongiellaceae bacterium]|jgi:protein MpaA